jgi:hypothetical protein
MISSIFNDCHRCAAAPCNMTRHDPEYCPNDQRIVNRLFTMRVYRPPTIMQKPGDVSPWLDHRVQRPWEKINHALVLLGNQGVGKDTLLEPVKAAIGPWNFWCLKSVISTFWHW